jgi:hypothetical protein
MFQKGFEDLPASQKTRHGNNLFAASELATIYIALRILKEMKDTLGLEAMLDYIERYLVATQQSCYELKQVCDGIIGRIDIEKIYREIM